MDPWSVPPAERVKHTQQFAALGPVGGFVTGEQAKGFLLQSQLPPQVLGQIWSMADVNCDGKMDINEFSVACKLITMKLRGFEIPPTLPPALKLVLAGTGTATPNANTTPLMSPTRSGIIMPPPVARPVPSAGGMGFGGMVSPPGSGLSTPPLVMPSQVPQQPPVMMPGMGAIPPSSLILGGYQNSGMPSAPPQENLVRSMSITSQEATHGFDASPLMEWAIPNPSRLKYTQLFNQNDRSKSGYLSGVQARNILMGTGLPQQVLATVWGMSDLDSDGRLSSEEFILSMHLCDVAKQFGRLPPKLPADLIPPSFRSGSRKQSIKSIPGSITVSGQNTGSNTPSMEPEPILSPGGTSFEDRRKQNYDKGQAELDRRRKLLEDMATREREERERKEKEEFDKREKQRLEIERRKQEEMEQQAAMRREAEERRMEELRKSEEQKEHARKEMERQRRAEMEENKRQDLLARRQKEQEEVLRLKGVNHGLGLELSQLTDKVKELSGKITETRIGVSSVKSEIDGMRTKRDTYMTDTSMLKAQLKDQNNRMLHVAQEKIRVEKLSAESEVKQSSLKQLREKLQNLKDEMSKKQGDTDLAVHELDELKTTLASLVGTCKVIYDDYRVKRDEVIAVRKKHHAEFDYNAAWGSTKPASIHDHQLSPTTVYYRALYDFDSRNPDELSFSAGVIIQRNDSVVPDPGWLSGWLDGKTGWFPETFVEVIPADESVSVPAHPTTTSQQPSVDYPAADDAEGEYYVALYQYDSAEPGDLPFEPGETILVTQSEGDWWTGHIGSDRSGIFPANYVAKPGDPAAVETLATNGDPSADSKHAPTQEVIHNSFTATTTLGDYSTPREAMPSKADLKPDEEAEIKREMSEIAQSAPPKSPKALGKSKKYEIATVLANYVSTGEGHLSLTRGQLITVRKKSPSGWWEGELQAKGKRREIGWFPGSYVKVLGPGGGSRQSSSRTTPIPFDEIEMPITTAPVYSDNKEQVIALYPYTAQNSDELTFVKDDVITIISKDEPDWWRGQLGSASGLFPVNYVQPLSQPNNQFRNEAVSRDSQDGYSSPKQHQQFSPENGYGRGYGVTRNSVGGANAVASPVIPYSSPPVAVNMSFGSEESKRQDSIREMIHTEEAYMSDMNVVKECFILPLYKSGLLTHDELTAIFVNWEDLIDCSNKLLKAFSVRNRTCENGVILMIGDILCQHMPAMITYIRFCSAQLRSASLIQQKTEKSPEFRDFSKQCQSNPKTQNLPLSTFLIKPMQRITRYPLLIRKILEHTPENHPDRQNLEEALSKSEELCAQVNEGVREKENSDRLEWMQTHISCEGLEERLIFNSLTNSLGPRKFLHHGVLKKTKSGKELIGFLFNDFLLMAIPNRPLSQTQFSFDRNKNLKFKMYRKPMFLNEINVEDEGLPSENEFMIEVEKITYQMYVSAPGVSEKRLWMRNIREAKKTNHQVEQQYLQRQRSKKSSVAGRLLVTVMEANNLADRSNSVRRRPVKGILRIRVIEGISLANRDPNGKSDPYCEVSLGSEIRKTNVIRGTLNPKWHDSMQFSVKDLHEDILCLTVYDKDYFSPDQFLGRTEIGIATIYEETRNQKTPWTKTFHLHEIESGNITIKFHLQIFERTK